MDVAVVQDRFVTVDGLRLRYIEQGSGVPAVLLHGASLGSSADVFRRNLGPLAAGGVRAIAFDLPGFGQSGDTPAPLGNAARTRLLLGFLDALGIGRAALIGHSNAGNLAVTTALAHPDRISHVVVLGTGSLLPPIEAEGTRVGGNEAAAQNRLEQRMVQKEPGLADTRALLEANLFNHELITEDELALRHKNSVGAPFDSFTARHAAQSSNKAKEGNTAKEGKEEVPLWQRLPELKMPLLLIYGRNDRARAGERAELMKQRLPALDLHIAEGCKHLVPWDAAEMFHRLAVPFLTGR